VFVVVKVILIFKKREQMTDVGLPVGEEKMVVQQSTVDVKDSRSPRETDQLVGDAEINVDDIDDDEDTEFDHEPTISTVDYSSQKLGICFWITIILALVALITIFIMSPLMGFLAMLSVAPAMLVFIGICLFKRRSISLELIFQMFWSGMLSVIGIFIVELALIVLFLFLFVGLGLIQIPAPQPTDPNFVVKLLQLKDFSFMARILFTLFQSFVVASFIEETTKYFLVSRVSYDGSSNRPIFYNSGPESSMIYSAIAALGLATLENVGYVLMNSYAETQLSQMSTTYLVVLENGILVALARSLVAIPVHVLTGALIGLNFYKYSGQDSQQLTSPPVKFKFLRIIFLPFLLHGIYDFVLMSTQAMRPDLVMFAFAFASVMVMILILVVWREFYLLNQRWRLVTSSTVLRDVMIDDDDDEDQELQDMASPKEQAKTSQQ
jgi:hypothetical protein